VKSYTTKPEKVCEISLKFRPPNTITTHLYSFKTTTRFPFYSPSYSQLPRLIILFLLKKLVGTNILKIENENYLRGKERVPLIPIPLFKRRRRKVKVDPKLGGQWKEKEKVPVLGGQWKVKEKVPMLSGQWKVKEKVHVFGGQWKVEEKSFSPLFTFPPTKFT
jgi:hypothetical protein